MIAAFEPCAQLSLPSAIIIKLVGLFMATFMHANLVAIDYSCVAVIFGLHLSQLGIAFGAILHSVFVVIHPGSPSHLG